MTTSIQKKREPKGCRYIHGHVGDPDWRYCQRPQKEGSSYCHEHHEICFVKPGSKKHEQAVEQDEEIKKSGVGA